MTISNYISLFLGLFATVSTVVSIYLLLKIKKMQGRRRRPTEPVHNQYEGLLSQINKLFISIKLNHLSDDSTDESLVKAKINHPLPTNAECDELQSKLTEALREFDKPARFY